MKKNLSFFSMSLLSSLLLVSCNKVPASITFKLNEVNGEIHSQEQLEHFIHDSEVVNDTYLHYLDGLNYKKDYSSSVGVNLSFSCQVDGGSVSSFTLSLSKNEDMSEAKTYAFSGTSYFIYNLEENTTYYWRVSAYSFTSETASFVTCNHSLRNLSIDGLKNSRDIGGSSVKQGMLYRGGELESYSSSTELVSSKITAQGLRTMSQDLGIKTEVDLRRNDNHENCDLTQSQIPGASYVSLPMYYGGNNILTYTDEIYDNPAQIKAFFALLADENNYPMYFHCSQGKDRTGCLAYLIERLLNEEEETIYRDYLFSNMADTSYGLKVTGITGQYEKTIKEYGDNSLSMSEKTYHYLSEVIGVSSATLDKVIELLHI